MNNRFLESFFPHERGVVGMGSYKICGYSLERQTCLRVPALVSNASESIAAYLDLGVQEHPCAWNFEENILNESVLSFIQRTVIMPA